MSDEIRPAIFDPEHYPEDAATQQKSESSFAALGGSAEPLAAHKPFKREGVACPKCSSEKVVLWHPMHREWIGAACQECGKQFNLPNNSSAQTR